MPPYCSWPRIKPAGANRCLLAAPAVAGLAPIQIDGFFDDWQGEPALIDDSNDDAGPVDAIIHSWRIARGKRWRIIGVGVVAMFIWVGSAMLYVLVASIGMGMDVSSIFSNPGLVFLPEKPSNDKRND